ncbi:hypothetical protein [Halocalculus aciditolerans]|uniref:Uncharacterized protein n=1 Tax=Halocalculus aciditolerans TaxID=1383812 RepID=A0A830F7E6_9EURY|nr:hypothetical protein [Halocalculus aciditolerans]GGL61743.1 hypothetical protein GCM10009039_19920 [Halocalculus aciditolerans]
MTRHDAVPSGDDTTPARPGPNPAADTFAGGRRSATATLTDQFRRVHGDHADPDPVLYRRVDGALTRLAATATGRETWDVVRWYALYGRLDSVGYDADWMHAQVEPRCTRCGGRLRYELDGDITGVCAADDDDCTDTDQLAAFRALVARLYERTFDDAFDAARLIVP